PNSAKYWQVWVPQHSRPISTDSKKINLRAFRKSRAMERREQPVEFAERARFIFWRLRSAKLFQQDQVSGSWGDTFPARSGVGILGSHFPSKMRCRAHGELMSCAPA